MKIIKNDSGSVTLEAAVFMPIFILFIVFLIFMIRFTLIDIAINQAANETAKNIATQVYPAKRMKDAAQEFIEGEIASNTKYTPIISDAKKVFTNIKGDLDALELTEGFYDLLPEVDITEMKNQAISHAISGPIESILIKELEPAVDIGFIEPENVSVSRASLGPDGKHIEIVVDYEFELPLPFIESKYKLQKRAYERLWIGS